MAFAVSKLNRRNADQEGVKRSPLAGWLGKKPKDEEDAMPQLDVANGVNRALQRSIAAPEKKKPADHSEQNPVRDALSAIEAALYAIDRIRDTLEQACEVAISTKDIEEVGGRALMAERYDELRLAVDYTLENSDPRATSLIGKNPRHIDVNLGGTTRYSVSSIRLDAGNKGLDLSPPRDAFATYEEIEESLEELDRALARADRAAASYCRDAQYLIARMNGEFGQ